MPDQTNEPITNVPLTDTFDLHHFAPRDMKMAAEAYLEEIIKSSFRHVRIIHGRGVGFQREVVHRLLLENRHVESFEDAPGEAGGWGATLITLRK